MTATLKRALRMRGDTVYERIKVFALSSLGRDTGIELTADRYGKFTLLTFKAMVGRLEFSEADQAVITRVREAIEQKFSLRSTLTLERVNARTLAMRIPLR